MFKKKRVLVVLLVWLAGITGSALGQNTWKWLGYNYPKLNSTRVETIGISPNDDVFVGFDSALIKLKNCKNEQWIHCLSEVPSYSIVFNSQGDVFVGSDTCIYISRDQGSHWEKMEGSPKFNRIYEMLWNQGTLWVGDKKSVYVYANDSWNKVLEAEGKKSFAKSPEGIFVGVYGKGVYYYDCQSKEWTYTDVTGIFGNNARGADNYMADMLFFNGKLWMVTVKQDIYRFGGIVTYDGKFWKELRLGAFSSQLPLIEFDSEYFTTLAVDSSGAIWFGSDVIPIGAYKLDSDGNWHHFEAGGYNKGLQYDDITSIAVDSQNRKWFGDFNWAITVLTEGTTAVESEPVVSPDDFTLFQNYPNPFNASTTINYQLARPGKVSLTIYNSRGRMVERLVDEYQQAGEYQVRFNASQLPSGIYIYRLRAGKHIKTREMVLIK